MLGNIVRDNNSSRVTYTWTDNSLITLSQNVISHIDELTPESYLVFKDASGGFLTFHLHQYINTTTDKRLTFTAALWTGLYTVVCSSTQADIGMVMMNADMNTSTWMFTGSIQPGQGKVTSWQATKILVI